MVYHKISIDGYNIVIIVSNSEYEAIGYYLKEIIGSSPTTYVYASDLDIEVLSADHEVEMECVGFPVYQTLEEIYNKKEDKSIPQKLVGLIE